MSATPPPPPSSAASPPAAAAVHPLNSSKPSPEPLYYPRRAWDLLSRVRARPPLVQCITNLVSMDLMANTLLALGASPAMVHSVHEVPDFTPRADAVLINVGTLTDAWLPGMRAAAVAAAAAGRPWVLDPVAVSASEFRMKACLGLVELRPAVIRGNASEILALSSACRFSDNKGADSSHESHDAGEAARSLSRKSGAVVAVSGAVDFVTDGHRVVGARNGVAMMQKITATGCSVTAVIASFVAMDPANVFEATACALSIFGLAGELGMEMAKGPASLRMHLIDSLYGLDEQTVSSRVSIVQVTRPTLQVCPPSPQLMGMQDKKSRGNSFTMQEDYLLVTAWLNTSMDGFLGNEQGSTSYWGRIFSYYDRYKTFASDRNERSLQQRFCSIQLATTKFCECFARIENAHRSGVDEQLKISHAKQMYTELHKKKFTYDHCWNLLRRQPKWLELIHKKIPKIEGKSGSSSPSISSPPTHGTAITLIDDDAPTSGFVNLERPAEKKDTKRKMEPENSSSSVPIVDLSLEMNQERRQDNEVKRQAGEEKRQVNEKETQLIEKRLELDKERLRLERIKEEERIMAMDMSRMDPDLQEYYSRLKKDILGRGRVGL